MGECRDKVIVANMKSRRMEAWTPPAKDKRKIRLSKRALSCAAAAVFCLSTGAALVFRDTQPAQSVMNHLSTGFEYDESIGRLQFVSNVLPESAMVFLSSTHEQEELVAPTFSQEIHAWNQDEPWIEYACSGDVASCLDGEIMSVVKNRSNEYTVRVRHESGYESLYSGLTEVFLQESDPVFAGESIGSASGNLAFEVRRDGLSVLPNFDTR